MILSYNWLKKYFPDADLPAADALAEELTMRFAEIEDVVAKDGDVLCTLKITPDRGCYGLSHAGVAYEIAALHSIGKENAQAYLRSAFALTRADMSDVQSKKIFEVAYDGCSVCHAAEVILGKAAQDHPTLGKIRTLLEVVGQRSISPLVDIINFVTLDIGQPLHAFDADKVQGALVLRPAKAGETMTTLDGTELKLDEQDAVTADSAAVLDLIGIKGGKVAETTADTQRVYLKAALYDGAAVRRSSKKHGLRTDAAKRFEQGIDTERPGMGLRYVLSLIAEIYSESEVSGYQEFIKKGGAADREGNEISLKIADVSSYIGATISEKEIESILMRLGFVVRKEDDALMVRPPAFRLDVRIDRDVIEEIARLHGIQDIASKQLPSVGGAAESDNALFALTYALRSSLAVAGAIELLTYSLHEKGDFEILNPVSPERSHARTSIVFKLEQALRVYGPEAVVVGYDDVTVFEIGSVFPEKEGEQVHLCIGVRAYKYKEKFVRAQLDAARQTIESSFAELGLSTPLTDIVVQEVMKDGVGVLELNISALASRLEGIAIPMVSTKVSPKPAEDFISPSAFPSVVRDIAFFAPAHVAEEALTDLIVSAASDLLINVWAFDRFAKPGEDTISCGFRLVFQSMERTLTDGEVQKDVDTVLTALTAAGYEPRV